MFLVFLCGKKSLSVSLKHFTLLHTTSQSLICPGNILFTALKINVAMSCRQGLGKVKLQSTSPWRDTCCYRHTLELSHWDLPASAYYNIMLNRNMASFHSCDQWECFLTKTKESVCIRTEFNSQKISWGHQHGCSSFVYRHQPGCHDVMWKHSMGLPPKSQFFLQYKNCQLTFHLHGSVHLV